MDNYLTYKGYAGTVDYSSDDEVFYGKIYGINDLVTFEGASVKELKSSFRNAVDDYVRTCAEIGKEPNKVFKGSFNVRLTTELHRKAALLAAKKSITLNDFVKTAISYAISHENDIDNQLIRL